MVAEHITNIPCTKHSGKRAHTLMLVVHSMETPLANGYALSLTQNWLGKWYQANGALIEASSNVIVSPDTLVRSVHTDYAAWHASWANSLSVGYEQSGYAAFSREQWLTPGGRDQIDRLAREMAQDAARYGIPLRWLTAAEVRAIANGDRTIKGLVTHAVIDPGNRTDPGSQYPYDVLLDSINAYAAGSTPQTIQEDEMSQADVNAITAAVNFAFNRLLTELPRDTAEAVLTKQVPHKHPTTGQDYGQTTSLATMAGFADFQHTSTRGTVASAARALVDTIKAAPGPDAGAVAEAAYAAFLAKLDGITVTVGGTK